MFLKIKYICVFSNGCIMINKTNKINFEFYNFIKIDLFGLEKNGTIEKKKLKNLKEVYNKKYITF